MTNGKAEGYAMNHPADDCDCEQCDERRGETIDQYFSETDVGCQHCKPVVDELLAACEELMPILREQIHWKRLGAGERKLILRIEAAMNEPQDDRCRCMGPAESGSRICRICHKSKR